MTPRSETSQPFCSLARDTTDQIQNLESDTEHANQARQMRRSGWRSTLSLRSDKTRERSIQDGLRDLLGLGNDC
jgi:hypothetical protein